MGKSEYQAYWELVAQAEQADSLGYDSFWLAEHHFVRSFSILAAPLTLHAALAQRTKKIRLGMSVSTLPLCQPVRLAAEAAVVDILSDGRLNLGVGRGHPWLYAGFNIPAEESRARFQENLEIILKAWAEERFSHEGNFYKLRDLSVVPKPVQKPHPPLYMGCITRESFEGAARLGARIMLPSTMIASFPSLREGQEIYERVWKEQGRETREVVSVISTPVYVAETKEAALTEAKGFIMNYYQSVRDAAHVLLSQYKQVPKGYGIYADILKLLDRLTYDIVLEDHVLFGDPDMVIEKLKRIEQMVGFTQHNSITNFGGIDHNLVMKSQKLFSQYVIPCFKSEPN
jgi:alkanesulfonate monooxygenase SsuD/methylene tetrahydromethanopterin reductase-like flavin-dependent oxidoreductase (luciferase family)